MNMKDMPEPDALKTAALFIAKNIFENDDTEYAILAVTRQLSAFSDHLVSKLEEETPALSVDCGYQCSYCCHMQVKVTPPEALSVYDYIRENFSASQLNTLVARIQNNRSLTEGKTLEDRVAQKQQTPCIFLTNHACDVYPVRPLVCRAWHSLNKAGCIAAYASQDPFAEIETTPERNYIYSMIKAALKDICLERNLTYGRYELPGIMDGCLSSQDPLKSWWSLKDSVFDPLSPAA